MTEEEKEITNKPAAAKQTGPQPVDLPEQKAREMKAEALRLSAQS